MGLPRSPFDVATIPTVANGPHVLSMVSPMLISMHYTVHVCTCMCDTMLHACMTILHLTLLCVLCLLLNYDEPSPNWV